MKDFTIFNQLTAMPKRLAMVLTMLLIVGIGQMWGAEEAVTISFANANQRVSQTTSQQVWKNGDVTFTNDKGASTSNVVNNTNPVRLYASSSITITAPGNITKIVATASTSNYATALKNSITSGATISGSVVTIIPSTSSTSYNIAKLSAQVRLSSIAITYEVAASCDKKVTIDKGTPSNGDFELSESGAQETCDGLTIVVTPTPHEHYVVNQVTATTPTTGGAPTITDNGNDTWSVTYAANSTGSSTIKVTFKDAPRATITLSEAGSTTTPSGTFYIGDSYTLPYSTDAECGDKTFVGWSTVTIDNSANKPTSDFYAPGVSVTLGANNTFYAVFAESGGVGSTSWVETDIANIAANDEVVITMSKTTDMWALSHENGSSDAPPADRFTDNTFDDVADVYIWNISNDNGSLIIYPKGSTSTWLYCTATNNGVRVGTNANKAFTISGDYLKNTATSRYVGVYTTNPDWRCYTSTTGNIANQTLAFYKKTTTGGYQNYTTECATQTAPTLTASENSLEFGNVTANTSVQKPFTLLGSDLTADAELTISGDDKDMFSVSPTTVSHSSGSINDQTITVTYTPTTKATHTATLTISSTGANDITVSLTGTGIAQTANYTIKHYQQNLDGTYPSTPTDTETKSAEVGTEVTPTVKTYPGFTAPSTKTVTIKSDGSTVVDYQYTRNSYTLTWDVNEGNALTGSYTSGSVKYGAAITKPSDPTRDGHSFKGWHNGSSIVTPATTMPANNLTYTAQWTPTYTITWFANGQEFHKQENAVEGDALDLPDSEPDAATYACDNKVFVGWTATPISGTTDDEPADLFTTKTAKVEEAATTYYAVFATEEDGGGSTGETTTVAVGDQVVIIQVDNNTTELTGFRSDKVITDNNNYGTHAAYDTTPSATLVWTIEEGASNGTFAFKNDDYYLNLGDNNNYLSCSTTKNANSSWTITESNGRAVVTNVQYSTRKIMWNQSSPRFASYAKNHGLNTNQYYYHIKFYKLNGGTSYSDYTTSCVALPDPVISFVTTPADPIVFDPVNCGSTTTKAQAKTIQVSGANLQEYVSVEVTGPYKIARTSSTNLSDYSTSLTLDKTNTGTIHSDYQTVYIISCPPAQSTDATTGTLTFTTKKGNTLTVNLSTPTVNCTTYALTFNDRGNKTVENYYAGASVPQPADPTGVCTEPIHYVFDGWADATVANGSTEYTKVTFPYSMPGQNKTLYAVYRYLTSGGNGDYNLVTSALDDWSGDYLIAYDNETFADGTVGGEGGIGKLRNKVDLSSYISNNTIPATEGDKYKVTLEAVTGGYVLKTQDGKYNYYTNNTENGISASTITYAQKYPINVKFVSQEQINLCLTGDAVGSVLRYNTTGYFRFYKNGGQQPVHLYKKASGTTLYTSAPVCGPLVEITSDKDIYVTGGKGVHSTVVAQKKITFSATRLQPNAGGNAPSIKVPAADITITGTPTTKVALSITQNMEEQGDGTYAGTGEITITYTPTEYNVNEDINVQLRAEYNTGSDVILDAFTIHARSLPQEFVIVAKQGDKWYALNGDMSNGSSANPANGQITLDDDENPTKATYAPCNTIYTFDGLPNTGDRTRVRFQGSDGAWLWAASGTNVGIQNKSLAQTPTGDNKPYNWKLETEDNITYKFHNDNNSRLLGLSTEKFGMYSSAVNDIRILPYDAKCLYNYAPTNLKVSVLKGTYVTLTWDAVAGATKYQYSTDATNWTDAGTEPTVTINGLSNGTNYTYCIRAYHADAGVSQECFDYSEITFTTADCDDVPTDITYTADLNSISVAWTASAATATIKLYSDEAGEHAFFTQSGATSPWKISSLQKNTTYYLQIFAGGNCASQIIKVRTEDVEVEIVEWFEQGIIVDINTDETVGVTLENEVSYGSGAGAEATELFFSKYYEATTNVKLVAIYNGTKNLIDLTDYEIHYGKDSWESQYITLKDFGATKGQIQPGEEIILYTMSDKDDSDKKIMDCVNGDYPDGKWVRVTQSNNEGKGHLSFAGNKTLVLKKAGTVIDIIGALDSTGKPTSKNANSKPSWGDANGWNCATGLSIAKQDSVIGISTNRCLLIRNNSVTSGDSAVAKNIDNFVTLCSEWKGAQVPDSDVDNGVAASCENFAYVGTFDYSDYYTQYESMGGEKEFDENARNADGTVTIPITDLYKQSCRNIRIKLSNSNGDVLTDREYKVPIMITTTQGTDGEAFIALQDNLAMMEITDDGDTIYHALELNDVREICKTCDVIIRDNATLMKKADDAENDHPQVRDVYVYENSSLIVPAGTNYTINSLSLRRKGDEVASLNVYPDALKLPESSAAPITLDLRIDAQNWHWFALPYNCNTSEVTWADGTPAKFNTDWFLMTYDGESRSKEQSAYENHWKQYFGTTIEEGKGYIVGITGDINNSERTYELRFPIAKEVLADEKKEKTVDVRAWGVEDDIRPNKKGWNLIGNPYLTHYQKNNVNSFGGLRLGELIGPDPQTGYWTQTGNLPYVVVPVKGGWVSYEQVLVSETDLLPFTAYFVQVGNDGKHTSEQDLKIAFDSTKLLLSTIPMPASLIRRAPSEVDEEEEPVIVGVSLTNTKGESDKTSLVIDDQFTDKYEMNADFFKWFGDYYKYYTKPVLYTIGADDGKRAFNAISEELATQPISLGMYAAQAGDYTFTLDRRSDLSKVQEVWLHDATQDTHINLLQESYTFHTAKTESAGRFFLSVKMAPKVSTEMDNVTDGTVWATTQDHTIVVNGLLSDAQLWIYDATGKLLHTDHTLYYQHSYSVPQSGTYFVRVQNTMQTQTIKVVVE